MSEKPPKDPNDFSPDAAKEPKQEGEVTNPLGDLLNQVSARADEKRAEISDQLRTQEADRARREREDTEKRRQVLLRKREKAIKKRQTQMLNAPNSNGSSANEKDSEPSQVPVADFDLNLKSSKPAWVWVALVGVALGGGGIFLSLQTDSSPTASPALSPETPPQSGEQVDEASPPQEPATAAVADVSESSRATADAKNAPADSAQIARSEDAASEKAGAKAEAPTTEKKPARRSRNKSRKSSSKRKIAKEEGESAPAKKKGSIGLKRGLFRSNIK